MISPADQPGSGRDHAAPLTGTGASPAARQRLASCLKKIQYQPRLIDGCLAGTGLALEPR